MASCHARLEWTFFFRRLRAKIFHHWEEETHQQGSGMQDEVKKGFMRRCPHVAPSETAKNERGLTNDTGRIGTGVINLLHVQTSINYYYYYFSKAISLSFMHEITPYQSTTARSRFVLLSPPPASLFLISTPSPAY
ncbi:hypothetical protein TESG_05212 [Trichophyton tonsurans CBS 112818]|uniref:Uncharacterized protein n=1 Tax=Trichophyton tonsurans (strain CBS 112818) TaxID=647933 RepID=F2S2X1_TRIT1|nr:hypothetical protein TESG_05212 [Trichophyton tonsurans CBS 112818]